MRLQELIFSEEMFWHTLIKGSSSMGRLQFSLPEDMVVEILCWLPVISLLQFRSVSKSWLSIISDPEFIQKHAYCSQIMARNKASLLMIENFNEITGRPLLAFPEYNYYLLIPKWYTVVGSCNGIICLVRRGFFRLWNPSTKQGMKIPRFPKTKEALTNGHYSKELAFGYDTISNDYKILRLMSPRADNTTAVPLLRIYSTNSSSWKMVHIHNTSAPKVLSYWRLTLGPIINGVVYMGYTGNLISFDLQSEVSAVVLYPNSVLRYSDILEFEGSVAVIFGSVGDGSGISLWTLHDIRGEVSWTKKFTVCDDIRWVYSYLGGGLLYGRTEENGCIEILYADKDKEFKCSEVPANNLDAVFKHTETLKAIQGFVPMRKLVPWFRPRI